MKNITLLMILIKKGWHYLAVNTINSINHKNNLKKIKVAFIV